MKVPTASILLGILSLSTCASAYLDYNELDARDHTNSLLVERGTLEIPFQHSLRSFLVEAADAHRRALDDHEDLLDARDNNLVDYNLQTFLNGVLKLQSGGLITTWQQTSPDWTAKDVQKKFMPVNPPPRTCKLHLSRHTGPVVSSLKTVQNKLVVLSCWEAGKTEAGIVTKPTRADEVELNFTILINSKGAGGRLSWVAPKSWTPAEAQEILLYGTGKAHGTTCIFRLGRRDGAIRDNLQTVEPHTLVFLVCVNPAFKS
ncbi:hypothetical protein DFP72DRAFT_931103 [Ephemerocybe angulata]|uniref:Uncharacterized protein n=1 Tax=Ephemerocybe angulata TaxID=980116 RepID=A0A8H6LVR0_9AGAR|nr:hypothetical protein DFP72DRAFT_931103 [Tulosesus angulatus]